MLYGRGAETEAIAALLDDARQGRSGVMVIRGEAGIGKTALLDEAARLAAAAGETTVLRGIGIETDVELPFAGLHLILRPVLDRVRALPARQAQALRRAFLLTEAEGQSGDDRFLAGLAVLSLLTEIGPVLCIVDDAHWLDGASAAALLFAARRLEAEGVAMLFAARDEADGAPPFVTAGLPECRPGPLAPDAARRLVAACAPDVGQDLRERVLTDAAGNPLALTELAATVLAGGAADVTEAGPLPSGRRVRDTFAREIRLLGEPAGLGLLVAAAEASGDTHVILDAAARIGAGPGALAQAERAGLITLTRRIEFRHPLIRSAAYYDAPLQLRQQAHRALAAALAPGTAHEPTDHPSTAHSLAGDVADRRVWHVAAAADGPDEEVAAELAAAAERARNRGAYAAVVAAYARAAALTPLAPDPRAKARRLIAAAAAATDVGQSRRAAQLADEADAVTDDPLLRAEVAYLRTLQHTPGQHERLSALADAATAIRDQYPRRAIQLLTSVLYSAWVSGDTEIAARVTAQLGASQPPPDALGPAEKAAREWLLVLPGSSSPGQPDVRTYLARIRADPGAAGPPERMRASALAFYAGDDDAVWEIASALEADCRAGGMAGWLTGTLQGVAIAQAGRGDWAGARASATEGLRLAQETGQQSRAAFQAGVLARLAALAGDEQGLRHWLAEHQRLGGPRRAHDHILSAFLAVLALSRAQFSPATAQLQAADLDDWFGGAGFQHQPDLVEAAARDGNADLAAHALAVFESWAAFSGQRWAAAVAARCRALISGPDEAGTLYAEAIALHEGSGRPFEQARTRLLYGEWLRRQLRRCDAEEQLAAALDTFEQLGAASWAERARTELRSTGLATLRVREPGPLSRLTPQEFQIARLAAAGVSNRDIAAQLFLSHRTVGYHLYKAYPKLGITSRGELAPFFKKS